MKSVVVTVDADEWRLPFSGVTALDLRDYRDVVNRPLRDALAGRGVDLPEIAGLLWLAIRGVQPTLTYDEVARRLTLDAVATVVIEED